MAIEKLLELDDICEVLRRGKTSVLRDVRGGEFDKGPRPIRLGVVLRWRQGDVRDFLDQKAREAGIESAPKKEEQPQYQQPARRRPGRPRKSEQHNNDAA